MAEKLGSQREKRGREKGKREREREEVNKNRSFSPPFIRSSSFLFEDDDKEKEEVGGDPI